MRASKVSQIVLPVFYVAISGSGGGSSASDPGPDPEPAIETRTVDLFDYVGGSLRYVQAYSEDYLVPTASELDQFDALANSLMSQNAKAAQSAAGNIGFQLFRIIDTGAGNNELYCLEEVALRGRGFYCVDFDSKFPTLRTTSTLSFIDSV